MYMIAVGSSFKLQLKKACMTLQLQSSRPTELQGPSVHACYYNYSTSMTYQNSAAASD